MLRKIVYRARHAAYKRGYRPAPGSILYSPSLAMIYAMTDAIPAFEKALKEGARRNV